ncbi:MAG: EAL domain-containing protein [Pseudomonas sp.]|nr:EAL domain-containing protein [Pseudomonas sp.]
MEAGQKVFYLILVSALGIFTVAYWLTVLLVYKKYIAKKQEESIFELNRFKLALEASHEALWDWSLSEDKEIYFSVDYCAKLGFTQEEFGHTQQAWRNHLLPEISEKVYQDVMRFIAEGDGQYDKTYRMLHRDKSHRWMRSRGRLIKDAQGKPIRFIGIARDVTEEYAAKVRLQQAQAVFESTREAVLITDHTNSIVYVNPSFTRITGYSEQEVIGKMPNILKSNRHSDDFHRGMWKDLNEKGMCSGEVWNCHKNGVLLRQYQTVKSIKNENGIVSHYVAVCSDISTIDDSLSELSFLSLYDPLTKLANRSHLCERLKISLSRAIKQQKNNALFLVGLDHFKNINESLGHNLGDQLLQDVALRIKEIAQLSNTLARTGGDEFALICEDVATVMDTVIAAEKIIQACKAPFMLAGNQIFISVSVGICLYPLAGGSVEEIMRNADSALHKAKDSGRETFAFYSTDMTEQAYQRIRIASELRRALENDELELHYQPVYVLNEQKLVGCEALVRWNHPTQGFMAPDKFIPIAEESDLISALDAWVLKTACEHMHMWLAQKISLEFIAVNLSSRSLSDADLADKVALVLQRNNLDAKFLELEVTESAVMENPERADIALCQLRDIGIRLAIDDFGTGYSSLARLKSLPVHKLKIDQSFIRNLPSDADDVAIVNAVLALGVSMGLTVQAEGIEKDEQVQFLQAHQCALGQGYLFGRPMPVKDFTVLLNKSLSMQIGLPLKE